MSYPQQPPGTDRIPIPGVAPQRPVQPPLPTATIPDPAFAGVGERFVGILMGGILRMVVFGVPVSLLFVAPRVLALVSLLVLLPAFTILQWFLLATTGRSLDKRMAGLAVLDEHSYLPIGWGRAFKRQIALAVVTGPTFGIGMIFLAIGISNEPRKRGWHDKVAGAVEVRMPLPHGLVTGGSQPPAPHGAYGPGPLTPAYPPVRQGHPAGQSGYPPAQPGYPGLPPVQSGYSQAGLNIDGPTPAPGPPRPAPVAPPPPNPSSQPRVDPVGLIQAVPGMTPPSPAAPPPASVPGPSIDSSTRSAPPNEEAAPQSVLRLAFEDGRTLPLHGTLVLGRNPSAGPADQEPDLVEVHDPAMSVSKTHAAFGGAPGSAWVEDRNSTNGVEIRRHGAVLTIEPMVRTPLQVGDVVSLGDRTFTVLG